MGDAIGDFCGRCMDGLVSLRRNASFSLVWLIVCIALRYGSGTISQSARAPAKGNARRPANAAQLAPIPAWPAATAGSIPIAQSGVGSAVKDERPPSGGEAPSA